MAPLSEADESRLRGEIDRRIDAYAARGLKTARMRETLEKSGSIALLEQYATADPDQVSGWKALVDTEPDLTLEWLVLNDPAAYRATSESAHEAAAWKLGRPRA